MYRDGNYFNSVPELCSHVTSQNRLTVKNARQVSGETQRGISSHLLGRAGRPLLVTAITFTTLLRTVIKDYSARVGSPRGPGLQESLFAMFIIKN